MTSFSVLSNPEDPQRETLAAQTRPEMLFVHGLEFQQFSPKDCTVVAAAYCFAEFQLRRCLVVEMFSSKTSVPGQSTLWRVLVDQGRSKTRVVVTRRPVWNSPL